MAGLSETADFIRMVDNISKAIDRLPNRLAAEAVNFSKQRFRDQAWRDESPEPWKKRKSEAGWGKRARPGRKILVDKGRLMRSIRKISATPNYIIIGTDVPYARIHNEGGTMDATQHVRAFTRRRPSKTIVTRSGNTKRRRSTGPDVSVKPFTRHIKYTMPKRQFLGPSGYLNRKLEALIINDITTAAQQR